MAERRMFAKTIIASDAFLEMPQSSQNLYFHLSMRADDDGFINNPSSVMRITGSKQDDISLLIAKKFIIPFDSGIVVIKHWKIHNYIQSDRYKETKYKTERAMLTLDENNAYRLPKIGDETPCIQNVSKMDTQVRLGKSRLELGESRLKDPITDDESDFEIIKEAVEKIKLKPFSEPLTEDEIRTIGIYEKHKR